MYEIFNFLLIWCCWYERFHQNSEKLLRNAITYILLFVIGFSIGFTIAYFEFDSTPATADDYAPLLEIQNDICKDFDNVYHYDNIDIDVVSPKNNIVVSTYNAECSIDIFFDNDLNYLYTEKNDNIDFPKSIAIMISSAVGIAFATLLICFFIILYTFTFIIFNKSNRTNTGCDIDH